MRTFGWITGVTLWITTVPAVLGQRSSLPRPPAPELLIQQQIDGWNRHNVDEFVAPYSDSTALYRFPNSLIRQFRSKAELRAYYTQFFDQNPNLHCDVPNQIVLGNTIILHEKVSGRADGRLIESIVTYKVENNRIARVYFDYQP